MKVESKGPAPLVTPRQVDEQTRADGTTIGDVRDLIPKDCFKIEASRSWTSLAICLVRLALSELLLTRIELTGWGPNLFWQVPALVLALFFAGWSFTGLFVLGHDCAHMSFSERKWVNEVVGHLTLAPTFTGFHNWRIWHNFHHAKTQLRAVDPDWPEKMMPRAEYDRAPIGEKAHVRLGFGTPLGMLVGFWVGMFRRSFMKQLAPQVPISRNAPKELLFSSLFMVAVCAGLSVLIYRFFGGWALAKYYYLPAFIAAGHGAMLTYLHHTSADALVFDKEEWNPLRGQVVSTINVRFPSWLEAWWFDINVHLPHHLAPKIPWYHLRRAAESIQTARPDLYIERRFSLGYLFAAWARPMLTKPAGRDYYEMVPFSATESEREVAVAPMASGGE